ncbi:MAG: glycosyltransferase family 39 protein [Deltaproteobacteria bacterium]|nr:glycosyltransferase family 39 protein [Deltaproteobacteria bacterium]MBW2399811.1 glycosyltransferase family 39 protein [Deltaproteobacteria bacterium]
MIGRNTALALFAAALLPRLVFVLWAPGEPAADGQFYHAYGEHIARGWGYIDLDGSPVVRWMPGWPMLLGGLYAVFGSGTQVALFANAFFDATTATLLSLLGSRLFGRRIGLCAGGLYALWPGMIFLCGSHMSEPLFNVLLVAALLLTVEAAGADSLRITRFAAAGLCLGAAALVKAEPLVTTPGIAFYLWQTRRGGADFTRTTAVLFLVAAAVLVPWTVRNYLTFDRFLPTAASGGIGVYLANHPGATGGQDFLANRALQQRFKRENAAWTAIARNDAGWRDAWAFVRANPGEESRIIANKLRLTYRSDARGAKLVRGLGPDPAAWHLDPATWQRLQWTANGYWFTMLALATVGLATTRSWKRGTAALLLLGVLLPWLCLHIVLLGGPRYHVPQIPVLALLAACGIAQLRRGRTAAEPASRTTPAPEMNPAGRETDPDPAETPRSD